MEKSNEKKNSNNNKKKKKRERKRKKKKNGDRRGHGVVAVVFIHTRPCLAISLARVVEGRPPRPGYFPNDSRRPIPTKLDGISRLCPPAFFFFFFLFSLLDFIPFFFFKLLSFLLFGIYERKWLSKRDAKNRIRHGEGEEVDRERAARSVTRGQRDVSMDGRVNERLFLISEVGFMQLWRRWRSTGVGRRGRAAFLFLFRTPKVSSLRPPPPRLFVVSFVSPLFSHRWNTDLTETRV